MGLKNAGVEKEGRKVNAGKSGSANSGEEKPTMERQINGVHVLARNVLKALN